jgi:hypothetical protein
LVNRRARRFLLGVETRMGNSVFKSLQRISYRTP